MIASNTPGSFTIVEAKHAEEDGDASEAAVTMDPSTTLAFFVGTMWDSMPADSFSSTAAEPMT